jgi:hypothetical protein
VIVFTVGPPVQEVSVELPALGQIDQYIRVPRVFQSFLRNDLFDRCLVCDHFLLADGKQYVIEKGIRNTEVIFEYAMCFDCYGSLGEELSSESSSRIEQYYHLRGVDFVGRRRELLRATSYSVNPWIDRCIVTGRARAGCSEYQIFAQCDGQDLLFTYVPFMISGDAIEEMVGLLSSKTRDRLNGFIDEFLGIPPELKSLPVV